MFSYFFFYFSNPLFLLELDNENLNSAAKQKWKPSASKQQCLEAYEFVDVLVMLKVIFSYSFFFLRLGGPCQRSSKVMKERPVVKLLILMNLCFENYFYYVLLILFYLVLKI